MSRRKRAGGSQGYPSAREPFPNRYCGVCLTEQDLKPMGPDSHPLVGYCIPCWESYTAHEVQR